MVRKTSLALVIAASLAPLSAHALGLGDIHLKSALNQELKADIDLLSVQSGELDTVKVELADPEAFDKAGLDRPYLLTQLRFRPVRRPDGSAVVEVTSRGPIREPFLNFLVEVNWPNGRLRREYTVLLDPPATLDRRPPAVAAPAAGVRPASPAARPSGAGAPAARTAMPGEYGPTRANDTLWEIAAALRPGGIGIEQMMIALQRANPDAFYRDNINYLKQGQILRVPAREEIQALSGSEARAAFLEQTARWEADRIGREAPSEAVVEPPADQVAEAGAPAAEPAPTTSAGELRIAAAPAEGTPAGAGEGGDAQANVEALQDELILAREANESMRQESVNLQSRVDDLESQLADMERLLALKDDQLAQLQATLGAEPQEPLADASETSAPEQGEAATAETAAVETAEGTETAAAEAGADAGGDTAMMSGETMPGEQMASGEGPGAAMESPDGMQEDLAAGSPEGGPMAPETQDEGGMTAAGETGPAAVPAMPEPEVAAAEPEPDSAPVREAAGAGGAPWSNPVFWGVGGLAVLLLGGLGVAATRKRKEAAEVGDESILVDNTEPSAQRSEGFATSGESDSQTDETSFLSDFSPSDIDALQDETGEVDPVSEADVYMAYNRYQQAEELLRQAVRREPERAELRFKLLDVLFAAQAADAFVNEAEDLAGAGAPREHPDEWRRVVSMGQDLAPEHPLFVDQEPSIGEETAMVGEQGEAHDLGDLDLGDIESELEAASGQSGWSDEERERPREAAVASAASAEPGSDGGDDWGVSDLEIESSSDFIAESEPALGEEPREESEFDFSELGDLDTRISGEAVEEGPYGAGRGEDASLSVDEAVGQVDIGGDLRDGDAKDALGTSSPDLEVDRMESIPDEDSVQIGGLDSALSELEASEDLALEEADTGAAAEQEPDLELPEMGEEDEVATKLDLARAYMDMGDEEGARSILDEVMAEGSDVQQSEARGLMERLA